MTRPGYTEIEVELEEEEVAHLVLAGMFTREEDGGLLITEKGSKWLREWLDAEERRQKS